MHIETFWVLGDPTRLRLLDALRAGERPVNDLVDAADIHQSGVSRHLRILQRAGFVTVRPHGAQRFYSLRAEPFRALDAWVGQYRRLWETRLDRLAHQLERKQRARATKRKETAS